MGDGLSTRVVAVGATAALIGGVVWAVVVVLTGLELGWIAWALGAFVGWAMARGAGGMHAQLAWPAAGLAVVGLLVGKWLILSVGAASGIAREISEYPDAVRAVAFQEMLDSHGFPPSLQGVLDTLSDEAQPDAATIDAIIAAVDARVAGWEPETRDSLIMAFAEREYAAIPWSERAQASLSAYDLLWIGLAVATAWRLAGGAQPAAAPVPISEPPPGDDE